MTVSIRRSFIIVGCFAALSCNSPRFEARWQLTTFRVMGVRVTPADVTPGDHVTLELATADIRPRPVSVLWLACLGGYQMTDVDAGPEGTGPGVRGCRDALTLGSGPSIALDLPADLGGIARAASIPVVGFACAGGTIARGTGDAPWPDCVGEGAEGWPFIRRVRLRPVRATTPPNHNPRISEVALIANGQHTVLDLQLTHVIAPCESGCGPYQVAIRFAPGSQESYADPAVTGGRRFEQLNTGFFIDTGSLATAFIPTGMGEAEPVIVNTWRPPSRPKTAHLFVYTTDGRDGFDWTSRTIQVQ